MVAAYRQTDTHHYFLGGYCSQWATTHFKGAIAHIGTNSDGPILRPRTQEVEFSSCEQYMMASKASVFEDFITMNEIMLTDDPSKQKALGRKVANFNPDVWNTHARHVVCVGNFYKFTQSDNARKFLDAIGDRKIVEGADYDKIWGVGIAWNDPLIEDEANWQGTNWLGESIMWVREMIKEHPSVRNPWTLRKQWL